MDIVIRPSGVWNSRAPLNDYIQENKSLTKTTSVLVFAIYSLRGAAKSQDDMSRSGRQFLKKVVKNEQVAAHAWKDYRRAYGPNEDGTLPQPTVEQVAADTIKSLYDVREFSIVRLSSLFESFAQCWAINYLIALLENGRVWSSRERELARMFHPAFGNGYVPSWPQIVRAFPFLYSGLSRLPHAFRHYSDRSEMTVPISSRVNAFSVIKFWRAYRNLTVHSSRLVTRPFYTRYGKLFSEMMNDLVHLNGRLEPGRPMPMHDDLRSAMGAAQYRAALWMNEQLRELTDDVRGHPEAPNRLTRTFFAQAPRSPPLLIEGDHPESVRWIKDRDYRLTLNQQNRWGIPSSNL